MPVDVHDLVGFLAGGWHLKRAIRPIRGVPSGGFEGTATFTPDGDVLDYEERGTARIGDHVGRATRRLRLVVDGPRARVHFEDGRLFHDLDLTAGRWEVVHPCAEDLYHGCFTVLGPDEWEQRWRVEGPDAAYELRTTLARVTTP